MIQRVGGEIFAPEPKDKAVCQIAAEFSSESKPLLPVDHTDATFFVDEMWTQRVLIGLFEISQRPPDMDVHGIELAQASYLLGELTDDLEEDLYQFLKQEARN